MRIVVYPHELIIGGSPINAIDLAAEVAARGHDVSIYGVPGPLVEYIAGKGLRYIPAHTLKYRPGPTRVWQLAQLARKERIDLIHAYEWPPCLDAYFGAHSAFGVPVVCTVLSMALVPLVPDSVPLVVGTRQLEAEARRDRSGTVALLEPPVDTTHDTPSVDGSGFRRQHDLGRDELLVVVVSRLSIDLKLDALVRAIDAVALLAERYAVRLVIVGTGEATGQLAHRADAANARLGRPAIILAGPTLDPRPAYAAADIVLGMGSSALRAMAYAKPVVVQGEKGFSRVLDAGSLELFSWQGYYGIGDGRPGADVLAEQLEGLVADPARRAALGILGHTVVTERHSLVAAADHLIGIYEAASCARRRAVTLVPEAARMAARAVANEARLHLPSDKRARREREAAELAAAATG